MGTSSSSPSVPTNEMLQAVPIAVLRQCPPTKCSKPCSDRGDTLTARGRLWDEFGQLSAGLLYAHLFVFANPAGLGLRRGARAASGYLMHAAQRYSLGDWAASVLLFFVGFFWVNRY